MPRNVERRANGRIQCRNPGNLESDGSPTTIRPDRTFSCSPEHAAAEVGSMQMARLELQNFALWTMPRSRMKNELPQLRCRCPDGAGNAFRPRGKGAKYVFGRRSGQRLFGLVEGQGRLDRNSASATGIVARPSPHDETRNCTRPASMPHIVEVSWRIFPATEAASPEPTTRRAIACRNARRWSCGPR